MPNFHELIDVFERAREFVVRESNDFGWSGWENADEAVLEIDAIIYALRGETMLTIARVLFLPTGPLQELSISSGWADEFLWLADWYDEGAQGVLCFCYNEPVRDVGTSIGRDSRYADVFIAQCPGCGRFWLRYYYEFEAESDSGRWFLGPLRRNVIEGVAAENAADVFEDMMWYFSGGSYFGGKVQRCSGEIQL
ncbi:MAG: hypothetical protein M3R13_11325 [Armatimonadota bacterium]|nr:hypothetical protein [Armatimonadota bacterium]